MTGSRIAIVILVMLVAAGSWEQWQQHVAIERLAERLQVTDEQLRSVSQQLYSLRFEVLTTSEQDQKLGTATSVSALVERLGSKNALVQYQASRALKQQPAAAVPALLAQVREGNSRGRTAAFLLLADLEAPESFPSLRELARPGISRDMRAPALGILAKGRDREARELFRLALADSDEEVRGGGLAGVRRLHDYEALGLIAARLGQEDNMLQREVVKTIMGLLKENPEAFAKQLASLIPQQRFEVCRLLGLENSPVTSQVLKRCLADPDGRVALTASHILAGRGNPEGAEVARRVLRDSNSDELKKLATEILNRAVPNN